MVVEVNVNMQVELTLTFSPVKISLQKSANSLPPVAFWQL